MAASFDCGRWLQQLLAISFRTNFLAFDPIFLQYFLEFILTAVGMRFLGILRLVMMEDFGLLIFLMMDINSILVVFLL